MSEYEELSKRVDELSKRVDALQGSPPEPPIITIPALIRCPNPACNAGPGVLMGQDRNVASGAFGKTRRHAYWISCGCCHMRGPQALDWAGARLAWNALPRKEEP